MRRKEQRCEQMSVDAGIADLDRMSARGVGGQIAMPREVRRGRKSQVEDGGTSLVSSDVWGCGTEL